MHWSRLSRCKRRIGNRWVVVDPSFCEEPRDHGPREVGSSNGRAVFGYGGPRLNAIPPAALRWSSCAASGDPARQCRFGEMVLDCYIIPAVHAGRAARRLRSPHYSGARDQGIAGVLLREEKANPTGARGAMTKLYAISDLHLGHEANREALREIEAHPGDWLILAGDVGERLSHLQFAFSTLTAKFAKLIWVPGNHELWTLPSGDGGLRGVARYEQLVALSRSYGVLTPEDPYPVFSFGGETVRIVPLFLLYDYSFRPPQVRLEDAVTWAAETDVVCTDELLLHSSPYPGRVQWCHDRCRMTERRLSHHWDRLPTVLINHFPLRESLVNLPSMPRFSLWCGTRLTENWHKRFDARVVVFGHLHMRSSSDLDGVRFEEVSFGYPEQWKGKRTIQQCLRQILPAPAE